MSLFPTWHSIMKMATVQPASPTAVPKMETVALKQGGSKVRPGEDGSNQCLQTETREAQESARNHPRLDQDLWVCIQEAFEFPPGSLELLTPQPPEFCKKSFPKGLRTITAVGQ